MWGGHGHKEPLRGRAPGCVCACAGLGSHRFSQGDVCEGSILSYQSTSSFPLNTFTHTRQSRRKQLDLR